MVKEREGWGWEGMEEEGTYRGTSQEKAEADLEAWVMSEARRIGGGKLPSERLDLHYDPDYTRLEVRDTPKGPELHIGTFGLKPSHFYQEGFREGISHELAHLALGELTSEVDSDTLIRQELRADLLGRKTISSEALVNLTKGVSKNYSFRLADSWEDVSTIAREEFGLSPGVLSRARELLGLH